jgi:hypothetical protein
MAVANTGLLGLHITTGFVDVKKRTLTRSNAKYDDILDDLSARMRGL